MTGKYVDCEQEVLPHSTVLRMGSRVKDLREEVGLGLGTEGSRKRMCL